MSDRNRSMLIDLIFLQVRTIVGRLGLVYQIRLYMYIYASSLSNQAIHVHETCRQNNPPILRSIATGRSLIPPNLFEL